MLDARQGGEVRALQIYMDTLAASGHYLFNGLKLAHNSVGEGRQSKKHLPGRGE